MVTVFGNEVEAKVDGVVRFDESPIGRRLLPGVESFVDSFPGSDFCMSSDHFTDGIPCNVTITGRTAQRWGGELWVRCRVEWVKDGELSDYSTGWYLV